ncbi:MAG TPA: carboxyl transferase domain-containing protein [Actinomycetota bacterium]|jgi:acetyl/propionyl-CoA carboxylase alpha subunit/acetyl-CoA carboxylase carboxyltransferase component|nr:carboxyl transferase domain-containing protein [Actinomycetota bacterium]
MGRDFKRIAIVNRGEPALRLIHAVRELNREQGLGLEAVALYTDLDRSAKFVREADGAVFLGSSSYLDEQGRRRNGYLDYQRLARALVDGRADAAWVGWGFVAEQPAFAELCERLGVRFIGPSAEVMRRLGDKIGAKLLAEAAGVPIAPWSGGPVATLEEARYHAARIGYPLMIKATAGGGGRGIRRVASEEGLAAALQGARDEARLAFGDSTVFMERLATGARHIEVQVIADDYGTVWPIGVRDCSVQRRYQKVIEESASTALTSEQEREVREAAARLCRAAGYTNAGTVEFLYDLERAEFSFMEVNARLQVEHPVTEVTTGLDLVKLQLLVARGERLTGAPPAPSGHAIEVRLNAEDPDRDFAPGPGRLELFRIAAGPGLRAETGVEEGDVIPAEFDSMIAKLIASGRDRGEALARLARALSESSVVIRGGATNKAFLLELLEHPDVRGGTVDTGWLDRITAGGRRRRAQRHADVAVLAAAVEVYEAELAAEQAQFLASAARGRPKLREGVGVTTELRLGGEVYRVTTLRLGPSEYRIEVDGHRMDAVVERLGRFERRVTCFGRRWRVLATAEAHGQLIEVEGVPHRVTQDDGGLVRAPAPAVVVSVAVSPGDDVRAGARLVVLEAMKMETSIFAPFAGRVTRVLVGANTRVDAGAALLQVKASGDREDPVATERVRFSDQLAGTGDGARERCARALDGLRRQVLGYDFGARDAKDLLRAYQAASGKLAADDRALLAGEEAVLGAFADVCALFQPRPDPGGPDEVQVHSTQYDLGAFLRFPDPGRERLPASFLDQLRRALRHYGVESLDRTARLEHSLLWIYKAHDRVERQLDAVTAILERRLDRVADLAPGAEPGQRELLERLAAATRRAHQGVSDLARQMRYRCFDQPLLERVRERVYDEARTHLRVLEQEADPPDLQDRLAALVACPQPLQHLLISRFPAAGMPLRLRMLEVLTRRYYRIRQLEGLRTAVVDGHALATAAYDHEDARIHVVTAFAKQDRLLDAARATFPLLAEIPEDHDVVVDLYAWGAGAGEDHDAAERAVREVLERAGFPRRLRRLVVALTCAEHGLGMVGTVHFTYRQAAGGFAEERLYRGLHPMMGKRLHLWRLCNFDVARLPSVEDVYLFRGAARDNPGDERLFALAEVRDVTPVRDAGGRVVALPQLERMLLEALAGIRAFQSHQPARRRLYWNWVLLYVWPPLRLQADEILGILRRLQPEADGLGLEKVLVRAHIPDPRGGELRDRVIHVAILDGRGLSVHVEDPTEEPIKPLTPYWQRVVQLRRRGLVYPYELIRMLTSEAGHGRSELPPGDFTEHDLDADGRLVPVDRPAGGNTAHLVVGVIRNATPTYPEGITRVVVLGDPSKSLGSLAEPECRRIIAAVDLAERLGVPLEWFPVSSGAKIAMDSGTENMDWIGRVLRRLVEFTQAGGEVNEVVNGINVGAQPYWNAEATMLMHTRGVLIMTPDGAMVLTGKQALDYSGGVSAEDNYGIGGYEPVMGRNGQAQYWAPDLTAACRLLLRHYEHTYVAPGERLPRAAATADPADRDVREYPIPADGTDFATVGEIFSDTANPERKRPFAIRSVMAAVIDADHRPLERWAAIRHAENAVVWDARLGGHPLTLIGIESRPLARRGFVPADGPEQWTSGTLFPQSSKKVARAINAASGNRPVVVLANLSGFDGSPESMRKLQLEYGAEIGRAVVNFRGPMVFLVVSRYHGGAFVVFSKALNEGLEVAALEGSFASVIGGAPAAAVVFARDVDARTSADPRVRALKAELEAAAPAEQGELRGRLQELTEAVRGEKLGEVADEFDRAHDVRRAQRVGSIDRIIPVRRMRPYLIDAVERGIRRTLERVPAGTRP